MESSGWLEIRVLHSSATFIIFISFQPPISASFWFFMHHMVPFCKSSFLLCFQHVESQASVDSEKPDSMAQRGFLQALLYKSKVRAFLQGNHLFRVLQG